MKIEDLLPKDSLEILVMKKIREFQNNGILDIKLDEQKLTIVDYSCFLYVLEYSLREIPFFENLNISYLEDSETFDYDFCFDGSIDDETLKRNNEILEFKVNEIHEMAVDDV